MALSFMGWLMKNGAVFGGLLVASLVATLASSSTMAQTPAPPELVATSDKVIRGFYQHYGAEIIGASR